MGAGGVKTQSRETAKRWAFTLVCRIEKRFADFALLPHFTGLVD